MPALRKIRALVVDDEPPARSNLLTLLRGDPEIELVGECGSGAEALAAIRNLHPDLVFLDVEMPEYDGFDVLEMLGAELPPAIVFVTAYNQYAIRAFEAGALDYLLKPFENSRFQRALARVKEKLARAAPSPVALDRFVVKSAGRVSFLHIRDVDWIEAADYYASLHVGSKAHLLRRSLADLERELDPAKFCRIHRSAIVNLSRVRHLEPNETGDYDVTLLNGARLRLSRTYRKQLQARLGILK